tara:strand:+ start:18 stop:1028 length:1011 start_codon:yes stop_codon:yes gene_type:complete
MSEIIENLLIYLSTQQYLDIFLYLFMLYFIFLGWKKGAIFQFFYLFTLLIAVALSFRYSDQIGAYISRWLNSNLQLSEVFGGSLIFVAILLISSYLLNLLSSRVHKADLGSKTLGAAISLLVSNLILTLIFTAINIINLPNYFQNTVTESNLANFYVSPEGSPQQTLEVIIGTDLLKVVNRINYLTGKSSVVIDDDGCLEIPKYTISNLQTRQDFSNEIYKLLSIERQNENVDGLELNQILSDVAEAYAYQMYTEGFWCHQNPINGESINERLSKVGYPYTIAGENLAITSTVRSGHQSLMQSDSHRNTILDNEFRRVGIGVVSGPLGLIIVQIFS